MLRFFESRRRRSGAPDPRPGGGPRRRLSLVAGAVALLAVALGLGALSSQASKIPPAHSSQPPPVHAAQPVTPPDPPSDPAPALPVEISRATSNAALELVGSRDGSPIRWLAAWGLWGNHNAPPGARVNWGSPYWWQSALDLRALIHYLQVTHDSNPVYQRVIVQTYQRNIRRPGTPVPLNFGNKFMDDTAWWGLAWLEAARYELSVRGNRALASRFLKVAAWTANYIWQQPRPCNQPGIEWETGFPADTITNAEFIALAGELAQFLQRPGPFQDTAAASTWTTRAWQILWWLRHVNLANIHTGHVYDGYSSACRIIGGSLVYTEGEMADALVQLGLATGQRFYFAQAKRFIDYAFKPRSRMIAGGVLQQPCEAEAQRCLNLITLADSTVYKGLYVAAVADWQAATGSHSYDDFLRRQGQAVIENAASNGSRATNCQTPHDCQLAFYWARPISPASQPVTPGSQFSGLEALTSALAAWGPRHS